MQNWYPRYRGMFAREPILLQLLAEQRLVINCSSLKSHIGYIIRRFHWLFWQYCVIIYGLYFFLTNKRVIAIKITFSMIMIMIVIMTMVMRMMMMVMTMMMMMMMMMMIMMMMMMMMKILLGGGVCGDADGEVVVKRSHFAPIQSDDKLAIKLAWYTIRKRPGDFERESLNVTSLAVLGRSKWLKLLNSPSCTYQIKCNVHEKNCQISWGAKWFHLLKKMSVKFRIVYSCIIEKQTAKMWSPKYPKIGHVRFCITINITRAEK